MLPLARSPVSGPLTQLSATRSEGKHSLRRPADSCTGSTVGSALGVTGPPRRRAGREDLRPAGTEKIAASMEEKLRRGEGKYTLENCSSTQHALVLRCSAQAPTMAPSRKPFGVPWVPGPF